MRRWKIRQLAETTGGFILLIFAMYELMRPVHPPLDRAFREAYNRELLRLYNSGEIDAERYLSAVMIGDSS